MKIRKTKPISDKACAVLCRMALHDVYSSSEKGLDALCDAAFGGDFVAMYDYVVEYKSERTSLSFPDQIDDAEICDKLGDDWEQYESLMCEEMENYTQQEALELAFDNNKSAIELAFMNGITAEDMGFEYDE